MKVRLADLAGNSLTKRVGFSYWYLFFGPFYLLARLRWEGLPLIILYGWLLPIRGMGRIVNWIQTWNLNAQVFNVIKSIFMFSRTPLNQLPFWVGIGVVAVFHLFFSFRCDNWLLKKKIAKKGLSPVSEEDARLLIHAHCVKPDVLLAREKAEKEHLHEQAEKVWEDKNLSYTTMLSRREMDATETGKKEQLSEKEKKDQEIQAKHANNAALLAKGVITKEEYEILEKRIGTRN
jgi:hypothetical protein